MRRQEYISTLLTLDSFAFKTGRPIMQSPNMKTVEALESFALNKHGLPEQDAIEAYERDGVVCIRNAFSDEWVNQGRKAIAAALRNSANSKQHTSHRERGEKGKFFYDTFLWKRYPSFRKFTFESPAATLARSVMQSESLLLYFDMAIVKEPGTSAATPWHYDEAYWPVSGSQICNVWTALDYVPLESALKFVAGSHKSTKDYKAIDFFSKQGKRGQTNPNPPQWENLAGDHRIVSTEMQPGDCAILSLRTHHSAPGNMQKNNRRRAICTHWFGDDARFNDKPFECNPDERGENLLHDGKLECETFPRIM